MMNNKCLVLTGIAIGLVPIIIGIVGLATPTWININPVSGGLTVVYSLFRRCTTTNLAGTSISDCIDVTTFETSQGLQIAGVFIIAVGVIIAIILKLFSSTSNIYLISPLLPMIGSILILIGFLLYTKYVIEDFVQSALEVNTGYSMILMVITCICGFVATAYFSFNAGYIYRNNLQISVVS
jgi:uncharacterized protein YjeT (DUF2065 family)